MAKVTFTEEDVNRSKVVEEAKWVPCEFVAYKEKTANTDGSALYVYSFKALSEKEKGMTFYAQFSEKAMGMMKNFVIAMGKPFNTKVSLDTETIIQKGQKIMLYVKPVEYNGNMKNEVKDFRPFGSETKSENQASAEKK